MVTNLGNIVSMGRAGGGAAITAFTISSGDFSGGTYSDARLSGKTPMEEFNITNLGSGTLKTWNVDYTFAGDTITIDPDDYLIEIY